MSRIGQEPPLLATDVPGPRSRKIAQQLASVESRNVTCADPPPICWERARGANVWDADGNRFVDLTAGFGVANVGHGHPAVVEAVTTQASRLLHALGDVHPSEVKVRLLEALVRRFPGDVAARAVLGSSGSDAIEIALKTAALKTGRAGVVAFEGAYHGVSLGALDTTSRSLFRGAFAARLPGATTFARFGDVDDVARAAGECPVPVGAVLVEPIQGRAGERIPPDGFLRALRERCDEEGWLLILDEIYTGFGRTGRWFACEHEDVVPDLLCVGKGLSSGMPISACLGRTEVMDAWPPSHGEAIHTQTFLGHPPSCAAALASMRVIEEESLDARAAEIGKIALEHLRHATRSHPKVEEVWGRGLLIGVELERSVDAAVACQRALARGIIVLRSGDDGHVVGVHPPLDIDRELLLASLDQLAEALR